jgi:hypothetical protein
LLERVEARERRLVLDGWGDSDWWASCWVSRARVTEGLRVERLGWDVGVGERVVVGETRSESTV